MYFCEKKEIDWKRFKPLLILTGIFIIIQIIIWTSSANLDISFWGSYSRVEGLLFWIFLIIYFILLMFNSWNLQKLKYYSFVIALSGLLVGGYGILQKFKLIPNIWASDVSERIISTMGNPLNLSAYLILVFPFIYFCLIYYKNIFVRIILIISILSSVTALYFSLSRSSWLAFLFANFVLLTFYFLKRTKRYFLF